MNLLNNFRKNDYVIKFFWLSTEHIFAPINAFIMILVARKLGSAEFGRLGFAYSIATFLVVIMGLGIDKILTRYLIVDIKSGYKMLVSAFIIRLLILWVILFSFIVINMLYPNQTIMFVSIISVLMCFGILISLGVLPLDAYHKFKIRAISKISGHVFSIIGRLVLIWLGFGILAIGIMKPVALLITFFICMYYSFKIFNLPLFTDIKFFDFYVNVKKLLKESYPVLLAGLLGEAYLNFDKILLFAIIGEEETGEYYATFNIVRFYSFIPGMIGLVFYPKLAKVLREKKYEDKLLEYFRFSNLFIGVIIIFSYLFIPTLIKILLPKYYETIFMFKILIWYLFFVGMNVAITQHLHLHSLQKYILYSSVLSLVVNMSASAYFIPKYKEEGAVYATLITYVFSGFLSTGIFKPLRSVFILQIRSLNVFPLLFSLITKFKKNES